MQTVLKMVPQKVKTPGSRSVKQITCICVTGVFFFFKVLLLFCLPTRFSCALKFLFLLLLLFNLVDTLFLERHNEMDKLASDFGESY